MHNNYCRYYSQVLVLSFSHSSTRFNTVSYALELLEGKIKFKKLSVVQLHLSPEIFKVFQINTLKKRSKVNHFARDMSTTNFMILSIPVFLGLWKKSKSLIWFLIFHTVPKLRLWTSPMIHNHVHHNPHEHSLHFVIFTLHQMPAS